MNKCENQIDGRLICAWEPLTGDGNHYPCHWYFAGKISKNDWRHHIVGDVGLRGEDPADANPLRIASAPEGTMYIGPTS
jgi:hypothetical protein